MRKVDVTPQQVAYLVQSVNAMVAVARVKNISIAQHIDSSDYRQWMFKQTATQKAWPFARLMISESFRAPVDSFIQTENTVS